MQRDTSYSIRLGDDGIYREFLTGDSGRYVVIAGVKVPIRETPSDYPKKPGFVHVVTPTLVDEAD